MWASFGDLTTEEDERFDCIVGPANTECNGVYYDFQEGSSSMISFTVLGPYNYLVWIDRDTPGILKK
jgi:hypothetical protein